MEEKEIDVFRLLGYYNSPVKEIKLDEPLSDNENELADRLQKTFDKTVDPNEEKNENFRKAIKDFIFLLKDKHARLYQYWPKNKKLLVQPEGSKLDKEDFISLALEYKSWFNPGDPIEIGILGTANIFTPYQSFYLYDFLRTFSKPGTWIEINSNSNVNTEPVKGAIQVVGKDFVVVQTKDLKTICATKNMNIKIGHNEEFGEISHDEETIEPMGTVIKQTPNFIIIKGNSGIIYQGKTENAIENLNRGDKVYFTTKLNKGKKYANFIHKAETANYCINLAKKLFESNQVLQGKEVLKHVLECFPDHSIALNLLSSPVTKDLASTPISKYSEALSKWNKGEKDESFLLFVELMKETNGDDDISVKEDCIKHIAYYYVEKYIKSGDEDDKTIAIDFIEDNFASLCEDDAITNKLQLYYKLGLYQDCIDLIDFQLDDEILDNNDKARLYFYKSQYLKQLGRYDESGKWAQYSLLINPFGNKAEKNLSTSDLFTTVPSRPDCEGNILYSILTDQINIKNISTSPQSILQRAKSWLLDDTDDYSFLPYAAVLDDKNTNKYFLEYLFKKASDLYDEYPESSIFIWRQIFSMVPGYGFFNHIVLQDALSTILETSPSENEENISKLFSAKINESSIITENEWNSIVLIISENKDVTEMVFNSIKSDDRLSTLFRQYVTSIEPTIMMDEMDGVAIVNRITTTLESNNREAVALFSNIASSAFSLEDITNGLSSLDYNNSPFDELQVRDNYYLVNLYESVLPLLMEYQNKSDVSERESLFDHIIEIINQVCQEIFSIPTCFAVLGLCRILEKTSHFLKKRQGLFDEANLAKLTISIATNTIRPYKKGAYKIGVKVINGEGLSTAEGVQLELRSQKLQTLAGKNQNSTKINAGDILGGGSVEVSFDVNLPKTITQRSSFEFAIGYKAISKGRKISGTVTPLQVRFQVEGDVFERITENPYKAGQGLPYKDRTFYGRDAEVRTIVNKILGNLNEIGTQLIVYGQAKCGKSSLLNRVQGELNDDHSEIIWCVKDQLLYDKKGGDYYDESDFFEEILSIIKKGLEGVNSSTKPSINIPDFQKEKSPVEAFGKAIIEFKRDMRETPGWEKRKLVLILDEFSGLYNNILDKKVSEQVLFHWKGIQENPLTSFATIFIGHDTTPLFFAEPYAANATSIIERMRISYLSEEAAEKLIQEPILTSDNRSRFEKEAVKRIKDYTACNPFYIQQFMQSMIEYINENEIIRVNRFDVNAIANNCLSGKDVIFSSERSFENLISPGVNEKYRIIKDEMYKTVLKTIANLNESPTNDDWCMLEDIEKVLLKDGDKRRLLFNKKEMIDRVIQDLVDREVVTKDISIYNRDVRVRIKVLLFKLWLLKN